MKIPQGLSRIEQETFFRTDAAATQWQFYSRDPRFKRLLERRGYTVTADHQGLWAAKVPLNALILRSRKSVTSVPTEEERQRRALLGKSLYAHRQKNKSESPDGVLPVPDVER